eukprot:225404_1
MGNKQQKQQENQNQIAPDNIQTFNEVMKGLDDPEKQQKIALMLLIDKTNNIDKMKAILKTFILTKSKHTFDSEAINAFTFNENELLSEKMQKILTLSLFIQCANKNIPPVIANIISEFAQKRIVLKIAHKSVSSCEIKEDIHQNDMVYIPTIA